MNKILISLFLLAGLTYHAEAYNTEIERVDSNMVIQLSQTIDSLKEEIKQLQKAAKKVNNLQQNTEQLSLQMAALEEKSDSVDNGLKNDVSYNIKHTDDILAVANKNIQDVETKFQSNAHWGFGCIVALLILVIAIYFVLHCGISKGTDAISAICAAQSHLEEESMKLDTKLIELLDRQLTIEKNQNSSTGITQQIPTPDHSFALKVADEITRIEKNLSRMDISVKGYKPLVKAIDRIKDNFKANGYEIVTYLGQTYNEGMRINPEFVIDETLPEGTRIITAVSKPQVHFNGELIQKASVTVSQNI